MKLISPTDFADFVDFFCDLKIESAFICGICGRLSSGVIMKLKIIDADFSICKLRDFSEVDFSSPFVFASKTDEENSLVCRIQDVPENAINRDDGWKAFRIEGVLDFSLIGILSKISSLLASEKIGIFAVSTFNTDYILVKKENFEKAFFALKDAGYEIVSVFDSF